jgi:uncharacterized membrane protein YkvA (DUF1232 family)
MIATLLYLVSPIDLIPDFIPFAGFVDELIIIPILFWLALKFIPKDIVEEYRGHGKNLKNKFKNVQEGVIVD